MNEAFIKRLKEILERFENSGCSGKCPECPLQKVVINIGEYKYDICDLLKEIWSVLKEG